MALSKTTVSLISVFATAVTTLTGAYLKYRTDQQTINRMESQPGKTASTEGTYEWQWAGDRWKGYVTVDRDGIASIDITKFAECAGVRKQLPLLDQDGNAKMMFLPNSTKIHVSIPVRFIIYDDKCNKTGYESPSRVLDGYLDQKIAYAGTINYMIGSHPGKPGDMVLVKDFASGDH